MKPKKYGQLESQPGRAKTTLAWDEKPAERLAKGCRLGLAMVVLY